MPMLYDQPVDRLLRRMMLPDMMRAKDLVERMRHVLIEKEQQAEECFTVPEFYDPRRKADPIFDPVQIRIQSLIDIQFP
jgi:hypothetical protein